jgi:excisionase family DNA binding protein
MSSGSDDPWLTVAEIADELRLTPATIRTWIADGTLQAKRAGKRKWLVRRSELDRMLRGEDYADAPAAPAEDADDPPPPMRAPDGVTGRSWPSGEHQFDPQIWLEIGESQWETAITWSRQTPPDSWFQERLKLIARAATIKAEALERLDAEKTARWDEAPLDPESGLSYELRPGANRPGPPELWDQFDVRVRALAVATEARRAGAISAALNELAVTLHDIAEELDRYRDPDGNWFPHPPEKFGGEPPEPSDQDPPTTDGSVS